MAALFALLASCCWGTSDFIGGSVAKTIGPLRTVFWRSLAGLLLVSLLALFVVDGNAYGSDVVLAVGSAFAVCVAILTLYAGLAVGRMGRLHQSQGC